MLYEEKECSVMQIQVLDEKGYWMKRTVFLVMDNELDWTRAYLKKICGKCPNIYPTCKKVRYASLL